MRQVTIREIFVRGGQLASAAIDSFGPLRTWRWGSPFAVNALHVNRLLQDLSVLCENTAIGQKGETGMLQQDTAFVEKCKAGVFDVLGLPQLSIGQDLDWSFEPLVGIKIPRFPWKIIEQMDSKRTGDKKVVWEVNRHQHLIRLGQLYVRSGDQEYAQLISAHLIDWIEGNPTEYGINWVSSLELAFRSISWLWALALTREWSGWTPQVTQRIATALHEHASHIERHLSYYSSPNTHLTGEALGLYCIGTCLPSLRRTAHWRALGRKILLDELERHVRPDGVYFEQSSWYHRYTADFYTHFVLLARRSGDELPLVVLERLQALMEHLMWITRPDGTSPYVGDDDGGKLVKLETRPPDDWRAALSNAAVLFNRPDFKHVAGRFADETLWLFGEDARRQFDALPAAPPAALSRAFPDGGYFVMRDGWQRHSRYLLVDCGPHGFKNGGHAHADALSIEVSALGQNFLTDPGTFVYTADLDQRNLFRSTAMHNTLTLDGQGSSEPAGPFQWHTKANSTLSCWQDHPKFTYFSGTHDGYRRLEKPAIHRRSILFPNREYWLVLDQVQGEGNWHAALHFHATPGLDCQLLGASKSPHVIGGSASLGIFASARYANWDVRSGNVSRCYGAIETAPWITLRFLASSCESVLTVLFPYANTSTAPIVEYVTVANGCGAVIESALGRDQVGWRLAQLTDWGLADSDFEWLWLRRARESWAIERIILLHGAQIRLSDFELIFAQPVDYVVVDVQGSKMCITISPPVTPVSLRAPKGLTVSLSNGGQAS